MLTDALSSLGGGGCPYRQTEEEEINHDSSKSSLITYPAVISNPILYRVTNLLFKEQSTDPV